MNTSHLVMAMSMLAANASAAGATRNGDLDPNFADGGIRMLDTTIISAFQPAFERLPDGTLVVGARMMVPEGGSRYTVARLDSNGHLQTGFGHGGLARFDLGPAVSEDELATMKVAPDGRIVAYGMAYTGRFELAIARLEADGTPDVAFGTDGLSLLYSGAYPEPGSVAVLDNRKILVTWSQLGPDGDTLMAARLHSDGELDMSFGQAGVATVEFGDAAFHYFERAKGIAIDSHGRILVGAEIQQAGGVNFGVARLLADGQQDHTFANKGYQLIDFDLGPTSVVRMYGVTPGVEDSITLMGGVSGSPAGRIALVHLQADGWPLPGFGDGLGRLEIPVFAPDAYMSTVAAMGGQWHNGHLLLAGFGYVHKNGERLPSTLLAQLDARGNLDRAFGVDGQRVLAVETERGPIHPTGVLVAGGRALLPSATSMYDPSGAVGVQAIILDVLFADGHETD